ncbi:MAG: hypothetical protein D6761_10940 [Candidatus Dadabacteria bacterium]|nr:MAG: hypothetical protein D6761_10940 [Candidatus Dadabacteria bacterium]
MEQIHPHLKAALMCHAPIVIPAIAGSRARDCAASTEAMRQCASFLLQGSPDGVLVVSPHTPRLPDRFGVVAGHGQVGGSFAPFGVPEVQLTLPSPPDLIRAFASAAAPIDVLELDHGALVPLWFLAEAGWRGPTVVFSLPMRPTDRSLEAFGEALAAITAHLGGRWSLVASGDMSHRLKPGAPAGYDPRAASFDAHVVAHVRAGDWAGAIDIDPELRAIAAEDVLDSLTIAAAAGGWRNNGHQVFAYEGPFGVGYLNAALYDWLAAGSTGGSR